MDQKQAKTAPTNEFPTFFYGTAWKEEQTELVTFKALSAGFRAIDTANQRKHYYEAAVGRAVRAFLNERGVARTDIFLQTKFTFPGGQDNRKPYDENAPIAEQVAQSFKSSLDHLGVEYLDSYLLHGPMWNSGLGEEDWEAWRAMESLHDAKQTRFLGISNVDLGQLTELNEKARVKPSFVQNRCFARTGWDKQVRHYCLDNKIAYQGFSLLTANAEELSTPVIKDIANKYDCTIAQVIFAFAHQVGMIPLTGTSSPKHMEEDLEAQALRLSAADILTIQTVTT